VQPARLPLDSVHSARNAPRSPPAPRRPARLRPSRRWRSRWDNRHARSRSAPDWTAGRAYPGALRARQRWLVSTQLHTRQRRLESLVPLLARPQVHRQRAQVVDLGDGASVDGEVDRLDVALAAVARLDADRRMPLGLEHGKLVGLCLTAHGACDADERALRAAD